MFDSVESAGGREIRRREKYNLENVMSGSGGTGGKGSTRKGIASVASSGEPLNVEMR